MPRREWTPQFLLRHEKRSRHVKMRGKKAREITDAHQSLPDAHGKGVLNKYWSRKILVEFYYVGLAVPNFFAKPSRNIDLFLAI